MAKKNLRQEHAEITKFLLKKSEEKDPESKKYVENVDKEEIESLAKKIKERIKV